MKLDWATKDLSKDNCRGIGGGEAIAKWRQIAYIKTCPTGQAE